MQWVQGTKTRLFPGQREGVGGGRGAAREVGDRTSRQSLSHKKGGRDQRTKQVGETAAGQARESERAGGGRPSGAPPPPPASAGGAPHQRRRVATRHEETVVVVEIEELRAC